MYINNNNANYFSSFGVEHIPKEIKKLIRTKIIITNIYGIQAYTSIMCGYFCIGFIDFMLKGQSLLDYKNSFYPNVYENNNIIINFFVKKIYCTKCKKYKEFIIYHISKISYICDKTLLLAKICKKYESENEKIFKEEESIEILNNLVLTENI